MPTTDIANNRTSLSRRGFLAGLCLTPALALPFVAPLDGSGDTEILALAERAADLAAKRAAHDQPHHHFDAFAAGFAQIFDVRNMPRFVGIGFEQIHEPVVPCAV